MKSPMSLIKPSNRAMSPLQRLLIAGGFAVAAIAPIAGVSAAHGAGPALPAVASCPDDQILDSSGVCQPVTDVVAPTVVAPTFDPINPEGAQLQPGAITSSEPGRVGQLPEVDGIPCDGSNTGQCIGLSENQPQFEQPESTISSSP